MAKTHKSAAHTFQNRLAGAAGATGRYAACGMYVCERRRLHRQWRYVTCKHCLTHRPKGK